LAWLLGAEGALLTLAWSLLNDAFRSEVCAMAAGEKLALAALLLAAELSRRVPELQQDAERLAQRLHRLLREPQLEEFLGLAEGDDVEDVCRELLAVYEDALGLPKEGASPPSLVEL
ncbi:unnamed protein product, partial [Effrenium voratum]